MPIETQKIDGLPVVIATYTSHITVEDVEQMYEDTEALLSNIDGTYYRINDVRYSKTTFEDFILTTSAMKQTGKFRSTDPNLCAMFVGTGTWVDNYSNLAKKQLNVNIQVFGNLEEAMDFIEYKMAKQQSNV